MNRNPAIAMLERSVKVLPDDDGRRALADPYAIIGRMAEDIRLLRKEPISRWRLRQFGWLDEQIDGWFESACLASEPLVGAAL
jgi:hypothetical protein